MLPTALYVDSNSLGEIKEIINTEEKKKEQLKADTKLSQDMATPSDNIFNQDTQILPQKLSTSSHNSSNSEEELVINHRNWVDSKNSNIYDNIMAVPSETLSPTSSRFRSLSSRIQSSLLQSPQDTPSSIATIFFDRLNYCH
ncbi:hypothetical protein [Candidatus Rickettsia colombianensi]|uniref:hypothetical protein n=1 Tax=Candidatus Rickettsia colombianensi TaxID=1090944 RepID=UPI000EF18B69|nr:hypothetical protein [Candidatus Rickettsia colombianensi]